MEAFGHNLDSFRMDDSQPEGPDPVYGEEIARYSPLAGRADRLAANIPGAMSIGSAKGLIR